MTLTIHIDFLFILIPVAITITIAIEVFIPLSCGDSLLARPVGSWGLMMIIRV
jgi:hypothetical protein